MTTSDDAHSPEDWDGRLTPSDVHHVLFTRAGLARRGYDEVEVDAFLERVQQELTRLIDEKADLRDDVARLTAQLARAGSDAAKYSQWLTVDAPDHSEQMVAEAREAAKRMVGAERLAGETAARTVDGQVVSVAGPTREELDQQVAYLKTFGQVVRVQLRAYLEALLRDVDEEWGRADPGVVLASPPALQTASDPASDVGPSPAGEQDPDGAEVEPHEPGDSTELVEQGDGVANGTRSRSRKRTTVTLHSR